MFFLPLALFRSSFIHVKNPVSLDRDAGFKDVSLWQENKRNVQENGDKHE